MATTDYYPKKSLSFLLPLLILVVVLYLLLAGILSRKQKSPEKEFIHYSLEDFHTMIGSNDQLAIAQVQALFGQYQGKYVRWTGEIAKLEKQSDHGFILFIKHLPSSDPYDVRLFIDDSKIDRIKNLKTGDIITYTGRLESYHPASGYFLEDGDIE